MRVPGESGGIEHQPYGREGEELYFDEGLGWVTRVGDELIFYDTFPEVTRSGDDIVVK